MFVSGPGVFDQFDLHLEGSIDACRGRRERGKEGVTLGPFLPADMSLEALADDPMVLGEDLGVDVIANATKERGGTLDVSGKEGQRFDFRIVRDVKTSSLNDRLL
jgi:hypothetical protein